MPRPIALLGGVALAAALVASSGCGPRNAGNDGPAAVVLISIDTLRADRLNSYGYRTRTTSPAIDRLAEEGILFERHVTASPWTTPAHLSLLTALSPSAHGLTQPISQIWVKLRRGEPAPRLADEHETLAEVLSARGYATAAFTGGRTVDPRTGFDQGFDSYDVSQTKLDDGALDPVVEWIRAHAHTPFFLFWHTFETHAPYLETDYVREVLSEGDARRLEEALGGIEAGRPGVRLHEKKARRRMERLGLYTLEVCAALYDGGVLSADRAVGTLVAALKEAGVYDRTLVVVTSDHGEQLGETAGPGGPAARDGRFYNAHGHTMYEENVLVPLVLKLPRAEGAGRRVAGVSRTIDVMPTVLDVLGVPGPPAMQGVSLRPLWESEDHPGLTAFSEAVNEPYESKSLRTDRHKYIVSFDWNQVEEHGRNGLPEPPDIVELYDLRSDPGEQLNLMADPTPEDAALAARLDAEIRSVAGERQGRSGETLLDETTLEQIRALGYAE